MDYFAVGEDGRLYGDYDMHSTQWERKAFVTMDAGLRVEDVLPEERADVLRFLESVASGKHGFGNVSFRN